MSHGSGAALFIEHLVERLGGARATPFTALMVSTTGARPVQAPDELASLGLDWPPRRQGNPEKTVKGQMMK